MRKVILITLFIIGVATSAFCFPDMGKYPHQIVKVKSTLARTSKTEDVIKMTRMSLDGFNGYHATCPLTGYDIYANLFGNNRSCAIFSPEKKSENSYFYMEQEAGYAFVANYFYFEDKNNSPVGRVTIIVHARGKAYAMWQSWIN